MTITTNLTGAKVHRSDDIAVWPDGTWAEIGDVWSGEYTFMSDDYEVVPIKDHARLDALGIADEVLQPAPTVSQPEAGIEPASGLSGAQPGAGMAAQIVPGCHGGPKASRTSG